MPSFYTVQVYDHRELAMRRFFGGIYRYSLIFGLPSGVFGTFQFLEVRIIHKSHDFFKLAVFITLYSQADRKGKGLFLHSPFQIHDFNGLKSFPQPTIVSGNTICTYITYIFTSTTIHSVVNGALLVIYVYVTLYLPKQKKT